MISLNAHICFIHIHCGLIVLQQPVVVSSVSVSNYVIKNNKSLKLQLQSSLQVLRKRVSLKFFQLHLCVFVTFHEQLERTSLQLVQLRRWEEKV